VRNVYRRLVRRTAPSTGAPAPRPTPTSAPAPTATLSPEHKLIAAQSADVMHFTTQSGFLTSVPTVYQPWDLQHLHLPEFFTPERIREREASYRAFCARAAHIVVPTTWVQRDLVAQYGLPAERITVVNPPPVTWAEMAAGLPSGLRTGSRRTRRRLEKIGARFEEAAATTLDEFLEALCRLHTARWQSRSEPGMLAEANLRAFHSEAAREMLRRGMLRLYGLRAGSRLLAVLYGFAARGRFYAYLSGFDPAVERFSPGAALLAMVIEQSIEEGLREFDLLRKRESYKYLWGAEEQVNRRLLVWHSPAFAHAA
jgi:hypothetical protein